MKLSGFSIDDILSKETVHREKHGKHHAAVYMAYDHRIPLHYSPYRRHCISPHSTSSNTSIPTTDDIDDDKVTRRPRTSITMCQREFLEREFQKERYPTLAYIDKLSRRINLPQYVIKVWFQNRRAKYRKEGHRRKNRSESSPTTTKKEDGKIDLTHELSLLPWNKDKFIKNTDTGDTCTSAHLYPWQQVGTKQKCSCLKCREGTCYVQY